MICEEERKKMSLDSILAAKRHMHKEPLQAAVKALQDEPGKLISRDANYEIAWYEEDDFRVIIYPHKTSAYNYHLRIRAQGKNKNSDRARYIMTKLYYCSPHDINFQWKGMSLNTVFDWKCEFGLGEQS